MNQPQFRNFLSAPKIYPRWEGRRPTYDCLGGRHRLSRVRIAFGVLSACAVAALEFAASVANAADAPAARDVPPPGYELFRQFSSAFRQACAVANPASCVLAGGAGTVITPDGYMVTNNHVVGGAKTLKVSIRGLSKPVTGRVLTNAPRDIAILKLEGNNFPFAPLGDSDKAKVGDWVVAIGRPHNIFFTNTHGVITQKFRGGDRKYLRTDTGQNPGNSGGGLFNLKGELIGVNGTVWGSFVCNATPSNYVKWLLASVKAGGGRYVGVQQLQRGFTGASTKDLTTDIAKVNNLQDQFGAVVTAVVPRSPAQKAGLAPGDIIRYFNGNKIDNAIFYEAVVRYSHPGIVAPVQIVRNGKPLNVTVRVGNNGGK